MQRFNPQNTRTRGQLLGAGALNIAQRNQDWLIKALLTEHGHPGASSPHNSLHIPRVVGGLVNTGSSHTATNLNAVYTGNSRPATGTVQLDLDAAYLGTDGSDVNGSYALVNVNGDGPATKPYIACVDWDTGGFDSPQVHIKKLSSALGAGNSWTAAHSDFDVAIFSLPYVPGTHSYLTQNDIEFNQGAGLHSPDSSYENLRGTVRNQGLWLAHLDEGHTTAGVHDTIEVPKEMGTVVQSAGTYSLDADADFASVSKLGTGQLAVTLNATYTSTAKIHPFVVADYSSGTGAIIAQARSYSTSVVRVYIYEFDGTNWDYADADFFLNVFAN